MIPKIKTEGLILTAGSFACRGRWVIVFSLGDGLKVAAHASLTRRRLFVLLLAAVCLNLTNCAPRLDEISNLTPEAKDIKDWPEPSLFPREQDLAILLPRIQDLRLHGQHTDMRGVPLLPKPWVEAAGRAFQATVVEDAFLTESDYDDWHVAAIRIVPCGPLEKIPGPSNADICWPGVRLVWQPTIFNIQIRNRVRPAYSDDRGMHVLYDFLPAEVESEASKMLASVRAGFDIDFDRFRQLRDIATEALLDEAYLLRQSETGDFGTLTYRWEMTKSPGLAKQFMQALVTFVGTQLSHLHVHSVTAMSLPEGRLPGPIGLWTFIAFEAKNGALTQQVIEVVDPDSGDVVGRLELDETVGIAEGDARLIEQMDGSRDGLILANQVIAKRSDIDRLRDRITDPRQTLVPNTSCATCHNFNRILFDFHNLSYFEALDITVSPRVERDVSYELDWVKIWRAAQTQ